MDKNKQGFRTLVSMVSKAHVMEILQSSPHHHDNMPVLEHPRHTHENGLPVSPIRLAKPQTRTTHCAGETRGGPPATRPGEHSGKIFWRGARRLRARLPCTSLRPQRNTPRHRDARARLPDAARMARARARRGRSSLSAQVPRSTSPL